MEAKRKLKTLIGTLALTIGITTIAGATTINYGIYHYNPLTGNPNGYAYTQTSYSVTTVGARAKVRNSDGTETYSPWSYNSNTDYVRSATVTANSYSSSGVVLYGYHYVKESGYLDWNGTSSYSY